MSDQRSRDVAARTSEAAQRALAWFAANTEKVRAERASLDKDFRKWSLAAKKCEAALERPMSVSVFGPSQAGKSYLISALARKGTSPLMADFDGKLLDFVKDLNPEGGKEATGLVTRFTLRRAKTPAGLPVALRLLSQTDIVKIIGNSYYSDCDQAEEQHPTVADIAKRFEELQSYAQSQAVDGLTEDDVYDLQEYFERYFKAESGIRALGQNYWPRCAALAPKLPIAHRAKLFGLIWNNIEDFTRLYVRLATSLKALAFADSANCGLDALMPREKSIINVDTLRGLGTDAAEKIPIVGSTGTRAELGRSDMTALIAELQITVAEKPWDFFDATDLLDFPGARSRERIQQVRQFLKRDVALESLYLRGKVAYLFERYCAEQELTAMLLCIGPSNQEVRTLPKMVRDWIDSTHGPAPADREQQQTALYFLLTKFDAEFEEKAGQSGSSEARWTARMMASLLDFFGKADEWPREWKPGVPFRNCFWLRNPNIAAKHIIDYDDNGKEKAIRPGEIERIGRMKREYLENQVIKDHFEDPERCWDEALRLNDGGISYLAGKLAPACNPEIKRRQIDGRVSHLRRLMRERLKRYHVSGDLDALLEDRRQKARTVVNHLIRCVQAQRFGTLLGRMQVEYGEIADVYFRVETQTEEGSGAASNAPQTGFMVGRGVDTAKLVADVFGDEGAGVDLGESTDQADRFAEGALDAWTLRVRELNSETFLQTYFAVPEEPMGWFVSEIITGAQRLGLKKRIAEEARRLTAFRQRFDLVVARPVMAAVNIINEHVNGLGYTQLPLAQRPLVGRPPNARPVFAPRPQIDGMPKLAPEPATYDQVFYADWIFAYRRFVEENVTVQDGKNVDVESNAEIGRVLAQLG
jgi:hypothetical protein